MTALGTRPWGMFQLLTSPGPAAIAVIRVRGPRVGDVLTNHIRPLGKPDAAGWSVDSVRRARLLDPGGAVIDDILLSVHAAAPNWDVRLHLHGSPGVVGCCTAIFIAAGFSELREDISSLWSTANTIEAEAFALLPRMLTAAGVRWLTRQSRRLAATLIALAAEPDLAAARQRCREIIGRRGVAEWFARPLRVALVGPPNVGKSTLANALADQHVSLVSPVPGTTRDWLEIPGEIGGFPIVWLDTAGLRDAEDAIETEAVRRTRTLVAAADALVVVLDAAAADAADERSLFGAQRAPRPACVALNKADLLPPAAAGCTLAPPAWRELAVRVSARERSGLEALGGRVLSSTGRDIKSLAEPAAFTDRQVAALEAALAETDAAFRDRLSECLDGGRRLEAPAAPGYDSTCP